MKNIAILSSGEARRGLELATIFNSGARYRVALLLSDNADAPALRAFSSLGIPAASASPEEWALRPGEIIRAIDESHIDLLALDGFDSPLPAPIAERFGNRIVILDGNTGPREIIAMFPDDFSTEGAWAQALGMDFDAEKAATPPAIPVPPAFNPAQSGDHAPLREAPRTQAAFNAPRPKGNANMPENMRPMPKTYLVWSIVATLLCCMAAGIVAIIFSAKVSSRYYAGDYEGAEKASRMAQAWIIASIVVGCVTNAIYFPLSMLS